MLFLYVFYVCFFLYYYMQCFQCGNYFKLVNLITTKCFLSVLQVVKSIVTKALFVSDCNLQSLEMHGM